MPRVTLQDHAKLKAHGLKVERWQDGWQLLDTNDPIDPEGDALMIGGHGCLAPTQWEAAAEGLGRIDSGQYA